MKKENKRKLKQFSLNEKIDFIIYLQELIVRIDKCIVKERKYLKVLLDFIQKTKSTNKNKDKKEIIVCYEQYQEFLSLLSGVEAYMLNLVGDSQKMAISYYKVRGIIKNRKKRGTLGFEMRDLEELDEKMLAQFNKARNWFNHVPESLLISEIELIKKGEFNSHKRNPIEVNYYNYCTLNYVEDLYSKSKELYDGVRHIHQCIKKDYTFLIEEKVRINRIYHDKPVNIDHTSVAKLSAEIQGM